MITDKLKWHVGSKTGVAIIDHSHRTIVYGRIEWDGFSWIDDSILSDETIAVAKNNIRKLLIREFYGDVLDWLDDAERLIYDGNIAGLNESIFQLRDKLNEKEPQK